MIGCIGGSSYHTNKSFIMYYHLTSCLFFPYSHQIVVTQPRRIAAIGVASRVAEERGEVVGGSSSSLGYMIRGENKTSTATRLAFCTTGIVLRRLQESGGGGGGGSGSSSAISCLTHLVIDEVHERSLDSDLLLALIRPLLHYHPHLRLILMSATMDTQRIINYFSSSTSSPPPPRLHIPGFTHPVEDLWLKQVCDLVGYSPPWMRAPGGGGGGGREEAEAIIDYRLLVRVVEYLTSQHFRTHYPGPSQVGQLSEELLANWRRRRRSNHDDDDDEEEGGREGD